MSVATILWKNVKWRYHHPFTILITILQPVLWLILYSAVAGETMQGSGIENYTAFIFPGLVILVIFSTSGSSGIMNYMMKSEGSFYRILIAPINRSAIIIGHILEVVLCTFFELAIMSLIARTLFSVHIFNGIKSTILILLIVFLTSFFMAAIAYTVSLILPNEMLYETIMNAIVLPIFFLSPALFPIDQINGMLKTIINLNPFTHIINSLRSIMLQGILVSSEIYFSIFLLIILSIITFILASHRLKKQIQL